VPVIDFTGIFVLYLYQQKIKEMPRYVAKLKENTLSGEAMSLEEFKQYYEKRYGTSSMDQLENRLERTDKQGVSCALGCTIDDFIEVSILNGRFESKQEVLDSLNLKK